MNIFNSKSISLQEQHETKSKLNNMQRYTKKKVSENCNLFYDHCSQRRVSLSSLIGPTLMLKLL